MIVEKAFVKDIPVWLSIDQFRTYNQDTETIDVTDKFVCYYKLSESTGIIHGELMRDANDRILLFNTAENARNYILTVLEEQFI